MWDIDDCPQIFTEKPKGLECPRCGRETEAEYVDNGFGPYSVQAGPHHCYNCGWTESCPYSEEKNCENCYKCVSQELCETPLKELPIK